MKYAVLVTLGILSSPAVIAAQVPPQEPASAEATALRTCVALADAGKGEEAAVSGKVAASLYGKRAEQNPRDVEALVGAARARSQCLLPAAGFLEQGELSSEAMDLLDRALDLQPDHWFARFVLASIAYRSPAFLGRGARAAREFDELLRMQGERNDNPLFARVFVMRGQQLSREGKADSARALWARGAALFPADTLLRKLSSPSPRGSTGIPQSESTAGRTARASSDTISVSPTTSLERVQVVASSGPAKAPLPSIKEVSRSQVLMTAGGTADVLQAVQMQPGATRVGEGGDVYTRGGDIAETSLMVNGGRILSLARFEGLSGSLFGAIEPFVVKSARYSTGGFSVRHGNALSGVLEIETDGRPRERQTRAGLSLVQASGTVRAPLASKVGGWVSGRVSHTGALLKTHGRTSEFDGAPWSQEIIASVIAAPTPFTEVRATALVERDDSRRVVTAAGWQGPFESKGDTRAAMLSSRWISSATPLVVRVSVAASSRSTDWGFGVLSRDRDESSVVTRVDADWEAGSWVMLRAGAEHGAHARVDRGTVPTTSGVATGAPVRILDDVRSSVEQLGGYTEAELTAGALSLTGGLRTDRLPGETETTFDPRLAISARYGAWTARASGGVFHQGRWRGDAAIPDAGTPSGLPRTARHLVMGVERANSAGLVRAEVFVKRYADYRAFGAGPVIQGATVRGLDLIAQRLSGRVTGWVGYSPLDARSQLADGRRVRGATDITHSATGAVTASLGSDWSVGTTARYGSGAPRTPILGGRSASDGRVDPIYGALMSGRLPAYARLDARLMRYIRSPVALLTTYAEVLNVTNRANVSSFTYDASYTTRQAMHSFFASRTLVVGGEVMFR